MTDTPDISGIFAGIETRLATISGMHASSEQPDQLNLPAAYPDPTSVEIDYDLDMGGSILLRLNVHLAVESPKAGWARAQVALLPYLAASGTYSVKAAIEGDQTLGSKVQTLRVGSARNFDAFEFAGVSYVGCDFSLEIWP